jgi:two-component system response regulator FimZ (fimbrial Z protein)
MEAILKPEGFKDIAIMGPDSFARQGISALLLQLGLQVTIKASVRDYDVLQMVFEKWHVDVLFIAETVTGQPGFNCLKVVNEIKSAYPDMLICMYSAEVTPYLWQRANVDAWFSLKDALAVWRANIFKIMKGQRRHTREIPDSFVLTQNEWRVLKEIKSGNSLTNIAQKQKISYRQASALKSSAIRKLGLKNKTDLLVFLSH